MKRGLIIGKFMPIHQGHIALIRFAALQCDEVIVSMSYTAADPIDHNLRIKWIEQIFKDEPGIRVEESLDDFDDEKLALPMRTLRWTGFIRKRFPPVDVIFSSEEYGEPFAKHLGADHLLFDIERKAVPVSATLIRNNPMTYWDYIPENVRPFFVKKICLYGPESTGKSTLAVQLASIYNTTFVPEVAREMITSNVFSTEDIIRIGVAQTERVIQQRAIANKYLFCDTDIITTQIYSRHYLNTVPARLFELEAEIQYDQYFLMDIDTPWVNDGLRDLGDRRVEMYDVFKSELEKRKISYIPVKGTLQERISVIQDRLLQWT